ncbi:hypothetical protein THAOC_04561, partial [Thalassiosira oceanica]
MFRRDGPIFGNGKSRQYGDGYERKVGSASPRPSLSDISGTGRTCGRVGSHPTRNQARESDGDRSAPARTPRPRATSEQLQLTRIERSIRRLAIATASASALATAAIAVPDVRGRTADGALAGGDGGDGLPPPLPVGQAPEPEPGRRPHGPEPRRDRRERQRERQHEVRGVLLGQVVPGRRFVRMGRAGVRGRDGGGNDAPAAAASAGRDALAAPGAHPAAAAAGAGLREPVAVPAAAPAGGLSDRLPAGLPDWLPNVGLPDAELPDAGLPEFGLPVPVAVRPAAGPDLRRHAVRQDERRRRRRPETEAGQVVEEEQVSQTVKVDEAGFVAPARGRVGVVVGEELEEVQGVAQVVQVGRPVGGRGGRPNRGWNMVKCPLPPTPPGPPTTARPGHTGCLLTSSRRDRRPIPHRTPSDAARHQKAYGAERDALPDATAGRRPHASSDAAAHAAAHASPDQSAGRGHAAPDATPV